MIVYFDAFVTPKDTGAHAVGGFFVPNTGMRGHFCFGQGAGMDNDVNDYETILFTLRAIWDTGYRGPLTLRGNSQTVMEQFRMGLPTRHDAALEPRLASLHKAAEFFESLDIERVDPDQNEAAELESRTALAEATGRPPPERLLGPVRTSRGTIAWSDPAEPTLEQFDAAVILRPGMIEAAMAEGSDTKPSATKKKGKQAKKDKDNETGLLL